MDRSSDQIDQANDIAQAHNDEAIDAVRRAAAPEQDPNNLDPECCDCGELIEPARLNLYKKRCLSCQKIKENKDRMYARY